MRNFVFIVCFGVAGSGLVDRAASATEGQTCLDDCHTGPAPTSTAPPPGASSSGTGDTSSSSGTSDTSSSDDTSSTDGDSDTSSSSSSGTSILTPTYEDPDPDPPDPTPSPASAPPANAWNDPSQSQYVTFDAPSGEDHMLVTFTADGPTAQELASEADDAANADDFRKAEHGNDRFLGQPANDDAPPAPTQRLVAPSSTAPGGFAVETVSSPVAVPPPPGYDGPRSDAQTAPPHENRELEIANTVLSATQGVAVNPLAARSQHDAGNIIIAAADQVGATTTDLAHDDRESVAAIDERAKEAADHLFGPIAWLKHANDAMESAPQRATDFIKDRLNAIKDSATRGCYAVLRAFSNTPQAPADDSN